MRRRASWRVTLIACLFLAEVGGAETSAFLWEPRTGMHELGSSMCARSINNRGQVCDFSSVIDVRGDRVQVVGRLER